MSGIVFNIAGIRVGVHVLPSRSNSEASNMPLTPRVALLRISIISREDRLDVADYGQILKSGWGEDPPNEVRDIMERKYKNLIVYT